MESETIRNGRCYNERSEREMRTVGLNLPEALKSVNQNNDVGEEPNPSMGLSLMRFYTVLVICALLTPVAAMAQTIPSDFSYLEKRQEFGLFGGYMSSGSGRFGYGPTGGPTLGARYGIELSGPMGFEGVIGVVDSQRDVVDPGRDEGDRIVGQADQLLTTIDARIRFSFAGRRSWKQLSPFLTFGGGMVLNSSDTAPADELLLSEDVFDFGTSFYGTLGVGSRWFITERFALRGDGVFSLYKIDTPPGFSDPARGFLNVEEGEWLAGTAFSISLLWRW